MFYIVFVVVFSGETQFSQFTKCQFLGVLEFGFNSTVAVVYNFSKGFFSFLRMYFGKFDLFLSVFVQHLFLLRRDISEELSRISSPNLIRFN